jgi:hypothetical protein
MLEYTIDSYRNAPSGVGPLAATWKDKPHRLIYDLCREVERLTPQLPPYFVYVGKLCVGHVRHTPGKGWRYQPYNQTKLSRKYWPSPQAAVNRRVKDYTLHTARLE